MIIFDWNFILWIIDVYESIIEWKNVNIEFTLGLSLARTGLMCCWNNLKVVKLAKSAALYSMWTSLRPKFSQTSSTVGMSSPPPDWNIQNHQTTLNNFERELFREFINNLVSFRIIWRNYIIYIRALTTWHINIVQYNEFH